ncbi:hypothetical protein D9M72_123060 [compost metagenome]
MAPRSARLAAALASEDSTLRRTRPHRSTSQLTLPVSEYWFDTLLPDADDEPLWPAPLPERVRPAPAPTVGKKPARAPRTSPSACR